VFTDVSIASSAFIKVLRVQEVLQDTTTVTNESIILYRNVGKTPPPTTTTTRCHMPGDTNLQQNHNVKFKPRRVLEFVHLAVVAKCKDRVLQLRETSGGKTHN
jgi:hypothetical protein